MTAGPYWFQPDASFSGTLSCSQKTAQSKLVHEFTPMVSKPFPLSYIRSEPERGTCWRAMVTGALGFQGGIQLASAGSKVSLLA